MTLSMANSDRKCDREIEMKFVCRSLAVEALFLGALTMVVPPADAGSKNRYKGGAKYSSGGYSAGVRGHNRGYGRHTYKRGYRRHTPERGYNRRGYQRGYSRHVYRRGHAQRGCYGAYCASPNRYAYRGYYPKPFYGPSIYQRYYGLMPNYRPRPGVRVSYSRAHYDYCNRRYRSYRASDNSFQPYHGPRKACRSPYR